MSIDVQLTHSCPHLSVEERVILNPDRKTLVTTQPIANIASVQITVNDLFTIPRAGVYTFARLVGQSAGPFRILANENDFTVRSGTETLSVSLPLGERITADTVIRLLRPLSEDIIFNNTNGHLDIIETSSVGPGSKLKVSGRAKEALGFEGRSGSSGKQIYPGWDLVQRFNTFDTSERIPRFTAPVPNSPVFKVTYSAPARACRRCGSSLVENDYRFDAAGNTITLANENLLVQAALKIVLTRRGSNVYQPFYGTSIHRQIGAKAVADVTSVLEEDIRRALANLQILQQKQGQSQVISYKERIYQINSVRATPHPKDQTTYRVEIIVTNASQEPIRISRVFTTPNAISVVPGVGVSANASQAGLSADMQAGLFQS